MKKIMVLGASILQVPAIQKAKEMGLYVIAVDMDPNAVGFQYADQCEVISTIDIPNVVECAKKNKIDAIGTMASDMPMRTVAAVAKEMNLVGVTMETAIKATDKVAMRNVLKDNNVPIPKFYLVNTKEEYLEAIKQFENRCIVKATSNSGSRGIFAVKNVKNQKEIEAAYEYCRKFARAPQLLVEEQMIGPEVSVESISIDGVCNVIQITDKLTNGAPYFVELGHSQPSKLEQSVLNEIKRVTALAVQAVGVVNGPSHTEIIVTEDGPKIVELGARMAGDNVASYLVPLSTGVNMVEAYIHLLLGEEMNIQRKWKRGSAIRYFRAEGGTIKSISNVEIASKIPGIKKIYFTKTIGEDNEKICNSSQRIGFVIAEAETPEEAVEICNKALNCVHVEIESSNLDNKIYELSK